MVSSSLRRSSSSGKVMMSIAREDSERSTMREKMRRCESSEDRKSTRLNSSHSQISYAVFCLKKKKKTNDELPSRYLTHYPVHFSPVTYITRLLRLKTGQQHFRPSLSVMHVCPASLCKLHVNI